MITLENLTELYRHMEWADATVWRAVLASDAGRADARLRELLYHLHLVQRGYLRLWRGDPLDVPHPTFEETEPLMRWAGTYYAEALEYLGRLNDHTASLTLPLPWVKMIEERLGYPPSETTLAETVFQVALHSQYHRGQVNARLREVGGEPPLVDYIAWLWMGRPAAEWPAD